MRKHTFIKAWLTICLAAFFLSCGNDSSTNPEPTTYTVSGRVVDGTGNGVSGVTVSISDKSATTDSTGNYSFSGLPIGNYTASYIKEDYTFNPSSIEITVTASDQPLVLSIVSCEPETPINQEPAPGTVSGYIADESGIGICGVTVNISDKMTVSNCTGYYSISGFSPGMYTASYLKEGYTFDPSSIEITVMDTEQTVVNMTGSFIILENTFVSIPGGTFQMGNDHAVTLSPFEMSIYEITVAQYEAYLNTAFEAGDIEVINSSVFGTTGEWSGKQYFLTIGLISYSDGKFIIASRMNNRPVTNMKWYGAKAFALYYGYDLPTEAEWEYACRGGKNYRYGTDDGTIDHSKANYNINIRHSTDVGSYSPNPFGLYDMSGNAWEWCHDWDGEYQGISETNPTGPETGSERIIRGGSWDWPSFQSTKRFEQSPEQSTNSLGFRVVRRPGGVIY